MDKKTATLTLTEKLRDNNSYHIIINPYYQKKLLEESIACYQIGEITAFGSYAVRDNLKNKNSALYERFEPKANYMFIESFEMDKRGTASSFAIVGKEEINQLRNAFYKNVPSDIEVAMQVLDIKNYAKLYEKYSNGELNKLLSGEYSLYLKFKESLSDMFIGSQFRYCTKDNFLKYFDTSQDYINKQLEIMGINDKVGFYEGKTISEDRVKNLVSEFENTFFIRQFKDLLPGFFDLAFAIPHEEQNIETNKAILKLPCETLDHVKILTGEYFKGKNFSEYFDCLDAEKQKKVINALESSKTDNSVYNSFLWSRGFKTIGLDHLRLYKENAEKFITYFQGKNIEEKKAILKDIMNCDATNEEVVNWLNENCLDLIRGVGLND